MQGTLTFVRIYSGTLETGTFVSNPNKGKKERIGRIQLMHANNREDIKVHFAALLLPRTCFCQAVTGLCSVHSYPIRGFANSNTRKYDVVGDTFSIRAYV